MKFATFRCSAARHRRPPLVSVPRLCGPARSRRRVQRLWRDPGRALFPSGQCAPRRRRLLLRACACPCRVLRQESRPPPFQLRLRLPVFGGAARRLSQAADAASQTTAHIDLWTICPLSSAAAEGSPLERMVRPLADVLPRHPTAQPTARTSFQGVVIVNLPLSRLAPVSLLG